MALLKLDNNGDLHNHMGFTGDIHLKGLTAIDRFSPVLFPENAFQLEEKPFALYAVYEIETNAEGTVSQVVGWVPVYRAKIVEPPKEDE